MQEDGKKRVSADIPFDFLNFELPRETRETLTDAVSIAEDPDARGEQALKSLANGGEGYCERF